MAQRKESGDAAASGAAWTAVSSREKRVVLVPQSWHNKTGEIVKQLANDVWVIERGYIWLGRIDVGGRTTLIKLPDGSLFVHAPLALTKVLKTCIDEIGPVRAVVAPNTEHVDFINQWKKFYPDAIYFGPPGSLEKLPEVQFTGELSETGEPDLLWKEANLSQFFIASAPFFNETVFVHHPSRSLLCTDLFWAYPTGPDVPKNTVRWAWAMNNVYKPVYDRILVKNQAEFKEMILSLLDSGFDKIIPCHGDIIEENGTDVVRQFFRRFV